ncbi:NlpC/P60 family protein [Clostridium sp. SYSU_GA19001]|uniref:C40 family peptidase n=1 Tax=Clostridium caldaquaticum TaxID=2940653 RepID=UPI0020771F4A|nr:C40 family peptidase [Clostridium caldaquaticum]MCM8709644.1 NlpC/P60 family protein [Clostridium caldaquaticum]
MKKRILSALVALGMVISFAVPVFASPTESQLNSQLKQQQSELQKDKSALKSLQDKREDLEQEIELMDFDIEELMRGISDTNKKIEQIQKDIKAAETEIKKAEEAMKAEKDLFNKRMRAMYINGVDGYLSILLEAKGFSDFLSRVEDIKKIAEADKKIIAELEAKKEDINKKKQALDNQNASLLALKAENEQKLAKLNESKKEQAKLIADLKKQEAQYTAEISESQKRISEISSQLQALRSKPVATVNPSRGATSNVSVNASGSDIVAFAYKFEGTPYRWGGTTPAGFDCSGFTQYVYRAFGVSLPRTAAAQASVGTPVSFDQLQPGDLVFFKRSGRPIHHVGIYVGNGTYIHSPQSGDVVKISDLNRRVGKDYYGAVRIKN